MAKTQTKPSKFRRFFSWFGHHKVSAVFLVLILALGANWAISTLVANAQIRAERNRFKAASHQIDIIQNKLNAGSGGKTLRRDFCSYTTPTSLFTTGARSCSVELKVVYPGVGLTVATEATDSEYLNLRQQFNDIKENTNIPEATNIATYGFSYQNLECLFSSNYYDSATLKSSRDAYAPDEGTALFMEVDCVGPAKAEYFPVVQD